MTRKIGETFVYDGKTYLVVETDEKSPKKCKKCCFFKTKCWRIDDTGHCLSSYRDDKKSVIFLNI